MLSPLEVASLAAPLFLSSLFLSPATARKTRLRNGAVLGGSLALHAVILAVLGWPMAARFQDRSDDEDAIRVTLEREFTARRPTLEPVASVERAAAASPIQPRAPRRVAPSWIQPLGVAPVPGPPAPSNRATGVHRRVIDRRVAGLGPERLVAMFLLTPVEADRAYRDAPMGVGVDHRNRDDPGKGKDIPWVLGAEQDGLGRSRSAEQQALKRLDDARKADERRKTAARQNEQR